MGFQFSEKITDEQREQIMYNVAEAMRSEIDTRGIVPDDAEFHTEKMTLANRGIGKAVEVDLRKFPVVTTKYNVE